MSKPRRNMMFDLQFFAEEYGSTVDQTTEVANTEVPDQGTGEGETVDNFLEIEFLKEKKGLSREDAIKYAQLGMNTERTVEKNSKLQQELEFLKNSPELRFMKSFLEKNGYESMADYENDLATQEIMKEEGLSKEHAMAVLRDRQRTEADNAAAEQSKLDEQSKQKETEMIQNFIKNFPDADFENIPEEVAEMARNGIDLSIAYELHTLRKGNDRVAIEQEVLAKLQANGNTSPGSLRGGQGDSKKSFSKMSKEEFAQYRAEVERGEHKRS